MSILIKGMKMPKAGEFLQVAENVDGTIFVRETTHGEWHQVIVVPKPHGGLVDREWLIGVAELNKDIYNEAIVDLDDLRNAPTVIEAEE